MYWEARIKSRRQKHTLAEPVLFITNHITDALSDLSWTAVLARAEPCVKNRMFQFPTPNVYISHSQVYISYFFTFLLINDIPVFRIFSRNYEFTSCNSEFLFIYLFIFKKNSVCILYFWLFLGILSLHTSRNYEINLTIVHFFLNKSELTFRNFYFSQKCKFMSQVYVLNLYFARKKRRRVRIMRSPIYLFFILLLCGRNKCL